MRAERTPHLNPLPASRGEWMRAERTPHPDPLPHCRFAGRGDGASRGEGIRGRSALAADGHRDGVQQQREREGHEAADAEQEADDAEVVDWLTLDQAKAVRDVDGGQRAAE